METIPTLTLVQVKYETCPNCGARIVAIDQSRWHTNGECRERVKYDCGAEISWSPNFDRHERDEECPKSDYMERKEEKRRALVCHLVNEIDAFDADPAFKAGVLMNASMGYWSLCGVKALEGKLKEEARKEEWIRSCVCDGRVSGDER